MPNYHHIPPDLQAAIFISSNIGGLLQLKYGEKDIRKLRKIEELIKRHQELLMLYPSWKSYDYVAIGTAIHLKIEDELQKLINQQLEKQNEEKVSE